MNSAHNSLLKMARTTSLYILVLGITMIILLPMVFLLSLSLMSDYEAYGWPFPLIPSVSAKFKIERLADTHRISIYNTLTKEFESLFEGNDMARVSVFIKRQTNCSISSSRLEEMTGSLAESERRIFTCRKNLLANYSMFFKVTPDAVPALLRSLKTAFMTMLISLVIGGMAGYAFARYAFRGKGVLRVSVLFVRIFPGVAIAIPMVIILADMGLFDNPIGLALVYSVGQIALTVWITASVFMGIPVELEEAAQVFGCTRSGAFLRVSLPLALPGLAACAMYSFIGSWNETIQALVLTQSNPTFPVVVYQTLVGSKGMVNLATAGGVTMALPTIIFTLVIRKYILRMWSGVKV